MDKLQEFEVAINAGGKDHEDFTRNVARFSEMETKMSCAPLCLKILGQVLLHSRGRDFSLKNEEMEFKYLSVPGSYRASISEICHQAFLSFRTAHSNMQKIEMSTQRIPDSMKGVIRLLVEGKPGKIERFLPIQLEDIQDIVESCLGDVKEVETSFAAVIEYMHEMTKASLLIQTQTVEAKDNAELKIKLGEMDKASKEEDLERRGKDIKESKAKLVEAEGEMKEVMGQLGSWGGLMKSTFASIVDTGLNVVVPAMAFSGGVNLVGQGLSAGAEMLGMAAVAGGAAYSAHQQNDEEKPAERVKSVDEEDLLAMAEKLKQDLGTTELFKKDEELDRSPQAIGRAKSMQILASKYKESVEANSEKHVLFATKLIGICESVGSLHDKIVKRMKQSFDTDVDLETEYRILKSEVDKLIASANAALGKPIHKKKGPGWRQKITDKLQSSKMAETLAREQQIKVELTRLQMQDQRAAYEKEQERQMKTQKELLAVSKELAKFNAEKATQAEVIAMLVKGLKYFAQLKEQWTALHLFFTSLSNLINTTLAKDLKLFIKNSRIIATPSADGSLLNLCDEIDQLYVPCNSALKVGALVNHLAGAYYTISDQHLMPLVVKHDQLLSCSEEEFAVKQSQLDRDVEKMQEALRQVIKDRKKEYESKENERLAQIEDLTQKHFPIPDDSSMEDIKAEAKQTYNEAKEMFDVDDYM